MKRKGTTIKDVDATTDADTDTDTETRGRGRPRKELPGIGDNIGGLIPDILKAFEKVDGLGKERDSINKKVQAIREDLFAKGIPKEAFDLADKYKDWPEDKRRNFDLAYACCRKAIGEPIQTDFLDRLSTVRQS